MADIIVPKNFKNLYRDLNLVFPNSIHEIIPYHNSDLHFQSLYDNYEYEDIDLIDEIREDLNGYYEEAEKNNFTCITSSTGLPRFLYKRIMRKEKNTGRFYHLCVCKYVKRSGSRMTDRFRLTSRHDSLFYVRFIDENNKIGNPKLIPLKLCFECYRLLNLGQYGYQYGYNQLNFPIDKFYKDVLFGKIKLNTNLSNFTETKYSPYISSWSKLARELKLARGFRCEECGMIGSFTLKNEPIFSSLEAHHKDKNPRNNMPDNIKILCPECHDKYHPNRPKEKRLEIESQNLTI